MRRILSIDAANSSVNLAPRNNHFSLHDMLAQGIGGQHDDTLALRTLGRTVRPLLELSARRPNPRDAAVGYTRASTAAKVTTV
jgi:hypothetical protein